VATIDRLCGVLLPRPPNWAFSLPGTCRGGETCQEEPQADHSCCSPDQGTLVIPELRLSQHWTMELKSLTTTKSTFCITSLHTCSHNPQHFRSTHHNAAGWKHSFCNNTDIALLSLPHNSMLHRTVITVSFGSFIGLISLGLKWWEPDWIPQQQRKQSPGGLS